MFAYNLPVARGTICLILGTWIDNEIIMCTIFGINTFGTPVAAYTSISVVMIRNKLRGNTDKIESL